MKFAMFGTGGVGGYFGGRLAAAGEDVTFIARGAHLEALHENGLKITSENGDVHLPAVQATADAAGLGPVDVVIFAVKLFDMAAAAQACKPLVGPDTLVISFQNGVDAADTLSDALGAPHVGGGVAYVMASIAAPGVIEHVGTMARMVIGERDGRLSARMKALAKACEKAGFGIKISDDIERDIWTKFAFLAPLTGVTALSRQTLGPIRESPELYGMLRSGVAEVVALGQARGVALDDGLAARHMAFYDSLPAAMASSMYHDITRGNRLELDFLSGAVVRLGKQAGVATPTHAFLYDALLPHRAGGAKPA